MLPLFRCQLIVALSLVLQENLPEDENNILMLSLNNTPHIENMVAQGTAKMLQRFQLLLRIQLPHIPLKNDPIDNVPAQGATENILAQGPICSLPSHISINTQNVVSPSTLSIDFNYKSNLAHHALSAASSAVLILSNSSKIDVLYTLLCDLYGGDFFEV